MRFSYRDNPQRRLAEVNSILEKQEKRGLVRRSDQMEPSARYHNVPGWRWFITGDGLQYREDTALARKQREAEARARDDASWQRESSRRAAAARFRVLRPRNFADRDDLVREIHAEGVLTMGEIGRAAGISRQRVHQILGQG